MTAGELEGKRILDDFMAQRAKGIFVNPEIIADWSNRMAQVQARIQAANLKAVQNALVDVTKGGPATDQARALLQPLAGARGMPEGFLGELERSAPAEIKRQQEFEAAGVRNVEDMARRDKDAKTAAAQKKKDEEAHRKAIRDRQGMRHRDLMERARLADEEDTFNDRVGRQAENDEKRGAAEEAKEQRRQALEAAKEAREERQRAQFRLHMETRQLERGYQNEMAWAKATHATADTISEINMRHTFLARKLEDKADALRENVVGAPGQ
jgi:hypothetical protein